jgi:Glucose-6-phosphate dehydrogenase, NAD binding domain
MDHAEYLRRVKSYIKVPTKEMEEQLESFTKLCTYISGQYDQDDSFINLNKHLEEIEKDQKEQNRIFYMALPPSVFITVSDQLKRNVYPKNGVARIIVSASSSSSFLTIYLTGYRLRNRSARTSRAPGSCRVLWSPIGRRRRFSVLIIT